MKKLIFVFVFAFLTKSMSAQCAPPDNVPPLKENKKILRQAKPDDCTWRVNSFEEDNPGNGVLLAKSKDGSHTFYVYKNNKWENVFETKNLFSYEYIDRKELKVIEIVDKKNTIKKIKLY